MRGWMAVAALFALPVQAQPAADEAACAPGTRAAAAILVDIVGLKVRTGEIRVEVYPANDRDWLADKDKLLAEGKPFRRTIANVPASGRLRLCVAMPEAGQYSVAVIHDPDFKRGLNIFTDGIGFPGDPRIGLSKPSYTKALVTIGPGVTERRVTMQYLRGFGVGPLRHPADGERRAAK